MVPIVPPPLDELPPLLPLEPPLEELPLPLLPLLLPTPLEDPTPLLLPTPPEELPLLLRPPLEELLPTPPDELPLLLRPPLDAPPPLLPNPPEDPTPLPLPVPPSSEARSAIESSGDLAPHPTIDPIANAIPSAVSPGRKYNPLTILLHTGSRASSRVPFTSQSEIKIAGSMYSSTT
jgi:hypothetical protein